MFGDLFIAIGATEQQFFDVVSRLEATGAIEQVSITKDWYLGYLRASQISSDLTPIASIAVVIRTLLGFGISRIFHFPGNGKREKLQNPGNFPGNSREIPSIFCSREFSRENP